MGCNNGKTMDEFEEDANALNERLLGKAKLNHKLFAVPQPDAQPEVPALEMYSDVNRMWSRKPAVPMPSWAQSDVINQFS